jgi:hypothetical protein
MALGVFRDASDAADIFGYSLATLSSRSARRTWHPKAGGGAQSLERWLATRGQTPQV